MTKDEFKQNYNKVKSLIKGFGPEIANEANVPYTTYFNVIRGHVSDPVKLEAVWTAMKDKAESLVSIVNEL